jgi:hypothetical protein
MAAGLIPIVPHVGGNSEFVPERYHYGTLEQAAEIVRNVLFSYFNNSYNTDIGYKMAITISNIANITEHETRLNLSNLVVSLPIEYTPHPVLYYLDCRSSFSTLTSKSFILKFSILLF